MSTPPPSSSSSLSADVPAIAVQESAFEDVMAFIDDFDSAPTAPLHPTSFAGASAGGDINEAEDDLLQSEEFLSFLDAAISKDASFFMQSLPSENTTIGTPSTPVATGAVAGVAKEETLPVKDATRKRNAYREKMKHELQYLRVRAAELEEKLTALRQGTTLLSPGDKALLDSAWKRIAHNQLECRKQSEVENGRLKSELQQYMQMTESMQQTLGKRLTMGELHGNTTKKGRMSAPVDAEGFAELAQDLDAAFARMDAVFRENEIEKFTVGATRSATVKMSVSERGDPLPYTELIDITVTPFHCRMTSRAVWRSALQHYIHHTRPSLERVWHTKNAFAVKFDDKCARENGDIVILQSKLVVKKFLDTADRAVIIWRSITESEDDPSGIFADETGWATVESISPSSGYSNSGSIIRTCVHLVRRHKESSLVLDSEAQMDPSVEKFTELLMSSGEEDLRSLAKTMESLLLDEVKSSDSCSAAAERKR